MDVFEITATQVPMNNETRVLGFKQAADVAEEEDAADQTPDDILAEMISDAQDFIDAEPDAQDVDLMRRVLAALNQLAGAEATEGDESGGKGLRRRADDVAMEHAAEGVPEREKAVDGTRTPPGAEWLIPPYEIEGVIAGELKAVWTGAYINDLPDSAFLYIEPGGSKDSEGKTTPRSLRHFPVKDANGSVDQAHVRNALSRIPQSNVPQGAKDRATAAARRMLDSSKAAEGVGAEAKAPRPADPLRRLADAVSLEFASDGESRRKPPQEVKVATRPTPELDLDELRQRTRDETIKAISGIEDV
jgi:hypothetical protein